MKKNLIILSDYGLDDAVAGAHLFLRRALFGKIFVVAVAGNVSAEVSLKNARKLLDNFEGDKEGIMLVETDERFQNYAVLPEVHGGDGMGDVIEKDGAYPFMKYSEFIGSLTGDGSGYIVLSLGPLTVTEKLMAEIPKAELVIMAGVVNEKPNYKGMEFNEALDVRAYENCIKKYPHAIATLDTCRNKAFNLAGHGFGGNKLITRLIDRAVELAQARHGDNAYIYDFIASLYLTDRNLFRVVRKTDSRGNELDEIELKDGAFSLAEYVKEI